MRPRPAAPPTARQAVVYVRVSTAGQAVDGVSLAAQEAACREHAGRLGLAVAAVHRDEGASGKDAVDDRPGLVAAIEAVQRAPGAVLVVYAISRLARRQRVLWEIVDDREGLGVPVSSATEPFDTSTPMGRAMLGMLAVWSALEADMISQRTRDALAHLKAQGVRLGAPTMAQRAGGAELVERVRAVAAGMPGASLRRLAEALNAAGVPSVSGRRWHPRTVRVALGGSPAGPAGASAPITVERVSTDVDVEAFERGGPLVAQIAEAPEYA